MTPVTCMAGRKLALFGLGGSGLATRAALKAGGADVLACDDSEAARAKAQAPGHHRRRPPRRGLVRLRRAGPRARRAADASRAALDGRARPGGRRRDHRRHRALLPRAGRDRARRALRRHHGHQRQVDHDGARRPHAARGRAATCRWAAISAPPSCRSRRRRADRVHVIEMSSFQIDLDALARARRVGVLLNVTPDHLDRHGTMEAYAAIKERLVAAARSRRRRRRRRDERGASRAGRRSRRATRAGRSRPTASSARALRRRARASWRRRGGQATPVADLAGIGSLRGTHNAQNAAAAVAVGLALGLDAAGHRCGPRAPSRASRTGWRRSAGVGRVLFVNDSKATNADSAEKALASFERDPLDPRRQGRRRAASRRCGRSSAGSRKAYLIGERERGVRRDARRRRAARPLRDARPRGRGRRPRDAGARRRATEPVVLLSPACASYDQYPNFEVRGDHFRDLVRALPGFAPLDDEARAVTGS